MFLFSKNKLTEFDTDEYNKHVDLSSNIAFPENNITAYFKNGNLYKVTPYTRVPLNYVAGYANKARYIVSDSKKYDLTKIESVNSIPNPKGDADSEIGVTGTLAYILKMHPETDDINLDVAILDKALSLMDHSFFDHNIDTYLQLPKMLYRRGKFELGNEKLSKILTSAKCAQKNNSFNRSVLERVLIDAKKTYDNDLIEIPALNTSCGECAKYQGRVYSAYGEDKRFPILPKHILESGCIHNGCRHTFMSYFYYEGAKIEVYDDMGNIVEKDVIEYSNRPFEDNRTETEKNRYLKLPKPTMGFGEEERKLLNFRQYCLIKYNDPDSAPKSFSAYMRKLNKQNKG